jgi:HTH-type transcriptional regulator / antitoxin HigA
MHIHPIRNDEDHRAAVREIERLWDAQEGSPEADMLEVLAMLVNDYERKRWPVEASDPIDILRYAIDEMGRSQAELAELVGKSRASELLNRRRHLTIDMANRISKAWSIPLAVLAVPYQLQRRAA